MLLDIDFRGVFKDTILTSKKTKPKINKWDLIILKSL